MSLSTMRTKNVIFVGKTGYGKTSICNLLGAPGSQKFAVGVGPRSCTRGHQIAFTADGKRLIDTTGLADIELSRDEVRLSLSQAVQAVSALGGVDVIFVVFSARTKATEEDLVTLAYLFDGILGERSYKNVVLLITQAEQLETQEDELRYLDEMRSIDYMRRLLDKVSGRVIFSRNPPASGNPKKEEINEVERTSTRDRVLSYVDRFADGLEPFRFEEMSEAQSEFDAEQQRIEDERRAAEERRIEDARELGREEADRRHQETMERLEARHEESMRAMSERINGIVRERDEAIRRAAEQGDRSKTIQLILRTLSTEVLPILLTAVQGASSRGGPARPVAAPRVPRR